MNFDFPLTGTERVELHIHSGGQVFFGNTAPEQPAPPAPLEPSPVRGASLPVRLFTHALVGIVCLTGGVALALRPHSDDLRTAAAWPSPHLGPILRSPAPSALPIARSPRAVEAADQDNPQLAAPQLVEMPEAMARQLAEPPVVTPPVSPPRTAPGGNAFGLDN